MSTSDQTKAHLAKVLKVQMQHKPLDRITIAELSAAAHVNRNTFYYHFDDIYALLKWTLEADIGRKVMQDLGAATWETKYQLVLDYIVANQIFCLNAFHSVGRDMLEEFLFQSATDMVKPVVLDIDPATPAQTVADICNFYGAAIVGQVLPWLAQSLKEPERNLIKRADLMLNGSIAFIVRKRSLGPQ